MRQNNIPQNIDEYISNFSPEVQRKLRDLRKLIKEVAPRAEEKISYGMPAFFQNGILIYSAGFKNHIGSYLAPSRKKAFKKELSVSSLEKVHVSFLLINRCLYN